MKKKKTTTTTTTATTTTTTTTKKKNHGTKKRRFFLIFTMKLSCTALIYLNAHSTLNFARTFLYIYTLTQIKHQRNKVLIL